MAGSRAAAVTWTARLDSIRGVAATDRAGIPGKGGRHCALVAATDLSLLFALAKTSKTSPRRNREPTRARGPLAGAHRDPFLVRLT
jgi:hypothetical protein